MLIRFYGSASFFIGNLALPNGTYPCILGIDHFSAAGNIQAAGMKS